MSADDVTVTVSDPIEYTEIKCEGPVRLMNGRLQQLYSVYDFARGRCVGKREDWRDVPVLTDGP